MWTLREVPWAAVAATAAAYCASLIFYRLFLHPLAKFPGPKLAAITRWYEGYFDVVLNGQYTFKIAELHRRYGPIVRISPYELHIDDPAYYEKLYRQDGKWNKYDWSYDAFGSPNTAVCTVDHDTHRRRRAPLGPFFSKASVAARQDMIQGFADKLCGRLLQVEGATVNITAAIGAYTRDVAMQFVLAKDVRNLEQEDFSVAMTSLLQSSGAIWRVTKHVRWVGPLMKSLPMDWLEKVGDDGTKAFFGFLKDCTQTTKTIMEESSSPKAGSESNRTIVHEILDANLPEAEKTLERVGDETSTVAGAAFETAAQTTRAILYYLYSNPDLLNRLRSELDQAAKEHGNEEGVIPLSTLEQLPFLTGVVREGLRLSPGVSSRLARVAPDRDLFYEQWRIPAGTPVGMTVLLMHLNEDVYPQPKTFNPDRWSDEAKRSDKTFAPFSRGTRICLGMYLAWAEMYIVVAALVQRLDFELVGAGPKDVDCASDQFIVGNEDQTGIKGIVKRQQTRKHNHIRLKHKTENTQDECGVKTSWAIRGPDSRLNIEPNPQHSDRGYIRSLLVEAGFKSEDRQLYEPSALLPVKDVDDLATVIWSSIGQPKGGWTQKDDEQWDEAIAKYKELPPTQPGYQVDGNGNVILTATAQIVIVRKED